MSALYFVFKTFFLEAVLSFGVLSFEHFCLWAKGSGPPGGPGPPTVVGGVAPSARPWLVEKGFKGCQSLFFSIELKKLSLEQCSRQ